MTNVIDLNVINKIVYAFFNCAYLYLRKLTFILIIN